MKREQCIQQTNEYSRLLFSSKLILQVETEKILGNLKIQSAIGIFTNIVK